MDIRLKDTLAGVQVMEPVAVDGLQVFGLRWDSEGRLPYTTLDDALEAGTLEITEVSEGGSVPELKVINKGDSTVLLVAGEQLIGAKQNRVLNASIMVDGNCELSVPVSCVEAGRWGYRSRKFGSRGSSSHGYLRRKMSRDAYDGYRATGRPSSKQGEVWAEIDRKMDCMGTASPSAAMEQVYEDYEERLNRMLRKVRAPKRCCGVAFVFGGTVAGVDLFDRPETLKRLFPKLVRAYAVDALEEQLAKSDTAPERRRKRSLKSIVSKLFRKKSRVPTGESVTAESGIAVDRETVAEWLQSAMTLDSEVFESPGLGEDVRIEGKSLVGASLVVDDQPVHTELFPDEAPAAC